MNLDFSKDILHGKESSNVGTITFLKTRGNSIPAGTKFVHYSVCAHSHALHFRVTLSRFHGFLGDTSIQPGSRETNEVKKQGADIGPWLGHFQPLVKGGAVRLWPSWLVAPFISLNHIATFSPLWRATTFEWNCGTLFPAQKRR